MEYIEQKNEFFNILNFINFYIGKKKVINILISGPPGIGKTFMCEKLAESLSCPYLEINGHPGLSREDLEGIPVLQNGSSGWQDGIIPLAIKKTNSEGICLLGIHEFNLMRLELQPSINSLLDYQGKFALTTNANKTYEIEEGKTLIVIATINENIAGVMSLQQSVRSRFHFKINLNYPKDEVESKILTMKTGIKKKYADILVSFAREARIAYNQAQLSNPISPRELIAFCEALKVPGLKIEDVFEYSIISKVAESKEEQELIHDIANGIDLINNLREAKFEGDNDDEEEDEEEEEVLKNRNQEFLTPGSQLIIVSEMNKKSVPLFVSYGNEYLVNRIPNEIIYKNQKYQVLQKGKRVPRNGTKVAKILKTVEIHWYDSDGKKRIVDTKASINLL